MGLWGLIKLSMYAEIGLLDQTPTRPNLAILSAHSPSKAQATSPRGFLECRRLQEHSFAWGSDGLMGMRGPLAVMLVFCLWDCPACYNLAVSSHGLSGEGVAWLHFVLGLLWFLHQLLLHRPFQHLISFLGPCLEG